MINKMIAAKVNNSNILKQINKNKKIIQNLFAINIMIIIPFIMYIKYYLNNQSLGDADFYQYFSGQKHMVNCILNRDYQWNKYLAAGVPSNAYASLYSLSLLFALLPMKEFIYSFYFFHLIIGAIGIYFFIKECDLSWITAFIYSIIFECSIHINGYRKGHMVLIPAICLFPYVVLFAKKYLKTEKKIWLIVSAFFAGIQTTSALQYGAYADVVLLIYLVIGGVQKKIPAKELFKNAIHWMLVYICTMSYSIIPTFSLIHEYSTFGSSSTTYDTFASYSIHPIKIFQMIYPKFFSNKFQAFGYMNSSEFDIELYLGIIVLSLSIFALFYIKKNFDILLSFICCCIAFLYASCAHIPVLNKLIFKIPVLGGFRCSGRMLYIFIFFMFILSAYGFEYIIKDQLLYSHDFINKSIKFYFVLMITTIAFCGFGSFFVSWNVSDNQEQLFMTIMSIFKTPFYLSLLMIILLFVYGKIIQKKKTQNIKYIFAVLVLCITLFETRPYAKGTNNSDLSVFTVQNEAMIDMDLQSPYYRIWDCFANVDGSHQSLISQNKNQNNNIMAINAYIAFNNPMLCKYFNNLGMGIDYVPFNFTGLMTGSLDAKNIVINKNNLLSMLSVKYIIDSSNIIENECINDASYNLVYDDGIKIYENINALSVFYSVVKTEHIDSYTDLYTNTSNYDLIDTAYISDSVPKINTKIDSMDIIKYDNCYAKIYVETTNDSYLCFSETYSPNWSVYIDGKKKEVNIVNGLIMGCYVPSGSHLIEFKYYDQSYVIGLIVSALSLLYVICSLIKHYRKG